jgi:hypothetical protein
MVRKDICVWLCPSTRSTKKYMVIFENGKTVHFGAAGYEDYTIHKDPERMERYTQRHEQKEDWSINGLYTPGFWAKHILWSKPSLKGAIRWTSNTFGIQIIQKYT